MIDRDQAERLLTNGGHLFSRDGSDLGVVLRFYLDEYSGWPSFATVASPDNAPSDRSGVSTSNLDRAEIFVALHEAVEVSAVIEVPYLLSQLQVAPRFAPDQDPSIEEEDALFDFYGVPIEGADPIVERLGTVLTPAEGQGAVNATSVRPTDHDTGSNALRRPAP